MQLEQMFTEQKWNILRALSEEPQSPLQLSQKLNTTMANISQQLKLLEAVNLVKKEKIRNRDKGKPRTLFSLNGEYAFLIPVTAKFTDKRLIKTTDHQKSILRIWFLDNHQHDIERFYWSIRDSLPSISAIIVDETAKKIHVVSDSKDALKGSSKPREIAIEQSSSKDQIALLAKLKGHHLAIIHHDSGGIS
jgi:predicted transcriptional regulator